MMSHVPVEEQPLLAACPGVARPSFAVIRLGEVAHMVVELAASKRIGAPVVRV